MTIGSTIQKQEEVVFSPVNEPFRFEDPKRTKSFSVTFFLSIFFGWIGADRFYLGYRVLGFAKMAVFIGLNALFFILTALFGDVLSWSAVVLFVLPANSILWWVADFFILISGHLKAENGTVLRGQDRLLIFAKCVPGVVALLFVGFILYALASPGRSVDRQRAAFVAPAGCDSEPIYSSRNQWGDSQHVMYSCKASTDEILQSLSGQSYTYARIQSATREQVRARTVNDVVSMRVSEPSKADIGKLDKLERRYLSVDFIAPAN